MTSLTSSNVSAHKVDTVLTEVRLPTFPAISSDKEDWPMGDLVEVDERERVGLKRRTRHLHNTCRARRRKVPGSITEAGGLAVASMDGATVLSSPATLLLVHLLIGELKIHFSDTKMKAQWLATKKANI